MVFTSFSELRAHFIDDAALVLRDVADRWRGEHVCSVALRTSDDVMGASLHCDTSEKRALRLAKPPEHGFIAALLRPFVTEWNTEAWDELYTSETPRMTFPSIRMKDEFEGMMTFQDSWCSENGRTFRHFRQCALRTMVDALAELDRQGAFGRGANRENTVLFVEITDASDGYFCILESVRLLNPPVTVRRFRRSLPLMTRLLISSAYCAHVIFRGRVIAKHSLA